MINDLECPYCHEYNEICHDDGQGYAEDEIHEQHCSSCDREFKFTTYMSFTYYPYCFEDKDHKFEETHIPGFYNCENCEESRSLKHGDKIK